MNSTHTKFTFLKALVLLSVFSISGQALAGTSEIRATTAGQDCARKGMTVGIVAVGAVALDCVFFGCAFTLAAAATLPVEFAATTVVLGTPVVAGVVGCAEGAVENVIVNG